VVGVRFSAPRTHFPRRPPCDTADDSEPVRIEL
jgi:hypothetical protein